MGTITDPRHYSETPDGWHSLAETGFDVDAWLEGELGADGLGDVLDYDVEPECDE